MKKELKRLVEDWIPLNDAKHKKYIVCPQIETEKRRSPPNGMADLIRPSVSHGLIKKGGKKNVKKKC